MPSTPPDTTEEKAFLAAYNPTDYPPVSVTVDMAILTVRDDRLAILLIRRAAPPFKGAWALPGGFLEPTEDVDAAAVRELEEETGLTLRSSHLEQLRTYADPDRDPRMRVVTVAFVAFIPDLPIPTAGSDAAAARYWFVDELFAANGPTLAFDHEHIIGDAIERTRSKIEYTTLATKFVTAPFTLGDLRRVYEAVWGISLDHPNFARKVIGTPGFVTATGQKTSGRIGRPGDLYQPGPGTLLDPPYTRPDNTVYYERRNP